MSVAAKVEKEFRVNTQAVLLTYQGFPSDLAAFLDVWTRFVVFARALVLQLGVEQWTATAETNEDGKHHLHLFLKFRSKLNRSATAFVFESVKPNVRSNDLLGEGFGGNRYQASVDRGHFYVWANKRGTVVDTSGALLRTGNCEPAWTRLEGTSLQDVRGATYKYKVSGDWPRKLWQEYKLDDAVYEEYLYLCRDKVAASKRGFELCRNWQRERELARNVAERTKRIRANAELYVKVELLLHRSAHSAEPWCSKPALGSHPRYQGVVSPRGGP